MLFTAGFIAYAIFLKFVTSSEVGQELKVIEVLMGSQDGDGMDGGFMGNQHWGGGRFRFTLDNGRENCKTGKLNSEYDNWERAEVNYFVGRQIGGCDGFDISGPNLTLTVNHKGILFMHSRSPKSGGTARAPANNENCERRSTQRSF